MSFVFSGDKCVTMQFMPPMRKYPAVRFALNCVIMMIYCVITVEYDILVVGLHYVQKDSRNKIKLARILYMVW